MKRRDSHVKVRGSMAAKRRSRQQPSRTQTLRTRAQIAMLKRALLAAEDEGLPHKAICDYLQTLSQMAKLESAANLAREIGNDPDAAPEPRKTVRQSKEIRTRLRHAVADIYGIADSPSDDAAASPPSSDPNDDSNK